MATKSATLAVLATLRVQTMTGTSQFSHLAQYNGWMNRKLYTSAAALPEAELERDRGAFFGSIVATLRHIMVADGNTDLLLLLPETP